MLNRFNGASFGQNASCEMAVVDADNYIKIIAVSIPIINEWIALKDAENLRTVVKDWPGNRNLLETIKSQLINCNKNAEAVRLSEAIAAGDEVVNKAKKTIGINPIWFLAGGAALLSTAAVFFIKKKRGGFSGYGCGCGL